MADKIITMEVVSPERLVLREEVDSLVVPAAQGYLGVLPDHAPLVTGLKPGVVKYRVNGEVKRMAVSGGFMEVKDNKAVLLADTAERAEEIDVARAIRAKERAERRLQERTADLDVARAETALQRSLARIRAAGK
ncbi:ATP synthase F0F1 subunit epsilon [Clostridiales bacterium PH28_bin88]|nr:ATP synthase F0F1 subunit epsilon [Clostridiales bacterium PH28_bin88]